MTWQIYIFPLARPHRALLVEALEIELAFFLFVCFCFVVLSVFFGGARVGLGLVFLRCSSVREFASNCTHLFKLFK